MKVYFYSLGCKVNQYDTEAMTERFRDAGWTISAQADGCDAFIVNSCTVTAESDRKTRQAVRRFKRNNPEAVVVLCGCMPQAFPEKAAQLSEADIITGNRDHMAILHDIEEYMNRLEEEKTQVVDIAEHARGDLFEDTGISASFAGRTRAVIKVQDGCDRYCSYCIIPTARGRSRSRSMESIEKELKNIKAAGYREVVLVGINFTCYGLDIGRTFVDPIALACSLGFDRVRIGSLEYDNITDEAIEKLSKLENFCPQFHMSLQSGCNSTLKTMRRHYTTEEYEETCRKLRATWPDTAITTDIMVGFPGETEEDFITSMEFAKRIGFEKIHVFPYSPREGTKAAEMEQIPKHIKEKRSHRMIKTADEIRERFLQSCVGKTVPVLAETYENGMASGHTENYTPVSFPSPRPLHNEIVDVNILQIKDGVCIGRRKEELL